MCLYYTPQLKRNYKIEIAGSKGGDLLDNINYGGKGAYLCGNISLTTNDKLKIVVGQLGMNRDVDNIDKTSAGGGGGTYVLKNSDNSAIIIAAGGNGNCENIRLSGSLPLVFQPVEEVEEPGDGNLENSPIMRKCKK